MGSSETVDGHGHWWQKVLVKKARPPCFGAISWKCLVKGGTTCYSKPPSTRFQFQYDASSYAQNFDEGCWQDSEHPYYRDFCSRFVVTPIGKPGEKNE
ncbi:hypothetical protein SUGI_1111820 [Cryptomeria japonica]|nr:hypothetical protein SUGI_1111820 [Cryptomeria japonica]